MNILYLCAGAIINRGVERYIMNLVSGMRKDFHIDVVTPLKCQNTQFQELIEKRGGKIFELGLCHIRRNLYVKYKKQLEDTICWNKYDMAEVHTGDIPLLGLSAWICRKNGIRRVILHTHNTHQRNLQYNIDRMIFLPFMKQATDFWTCSVKAGNDSFPERVQYKVKWIPNAIDIEKFKFDLTSRSKIRKKLCIGRKIVIGHIGAFERQKNHKFLIEVFAKICEKSDNYVLFLAGEGALLNEIKKKVKMFKLEEKVIFYGISDNVHEVLNAVDIFVMPSLWEGFGIAAIEAQANGLPCVLSDALPKEAFVTDSCEVLPVRKNHAERWKNAIMASDIQTNREKGYVDICSSPYQLEKMREKVVQSYMAMFSSEQKKAGKI